MKGMVLVPEVWPHLGADQVAYLLHGEEIRIVAAVVGKTRLQALGSGSAAIFIGGEPDTGRRQDGIIALKVHGIVAIADRDHFLMDFFPGTDADDFLAAFRTDRLGDISDAIGRDLW